MITETTKYGKEYETPQGLKEDQYYELMYEFVDLVKAKGLTTRQAQKLFTDCADMVLDVKICSNSTNDTQDNESDLQKIVKELIYIGERLEYLPTRLYAGNKL